MVTDRGKPSRRDLGKSVLVLATIAGFILGVLTQRSDNAYLGLALIGLALFALCVPFTLAALLPYGSLRRAVVILSIVLLCALTALGGLMLISILFDLSSQRYSYPSAFYVRHWAGLILLVSATCVFGYRFSR